jgi:hypothetical protein
MRAKQGLMDFGNGELPLFSGTPQSVALEGAQGGSAQGAQLSFFACRFCKDGGRISGRYCMCEAGTRARLEDRAQQKKGESDVLTSSETL